MADNGSYWSPPKDNHSCVDKYIRGQYAVAMRPEQPAGYDDMFPTILECHYEQFPRKGVELPDHGELWPLEWT